jgi:predicted DNA-binding transcriptional regulator AlpA
MPALMRLERVSQRGLFCFGRSQKERVEPLLNVSQVSELLQCTPRQVFELSRNRSQVRGRNPLPCIKIHKKMLRFRRADVEQWLNDLTTSAIKTS